jgi:uncharacterized protein YbjT (DUF2867 family)
MLDAQQPDTIPPALNGMNALVYLIHQMGQAGDFVTRERAAAEAVVRAAEQAGVTRIVYLGGIEPAGAPSRHLKSRLDTGEVLRSGRVPALEVRTSMIIGPGSQSFRMVRDLAARLPLMVLPSWLRNRSEPVGVDDVVAALVKALELPREQCGVFDLPGPELLSGEEILQRVARLLGIRPYFVRVPVLTPKLSGYWLRFVTRANYEVAQELVHGLTCDLIARGDSFWRLMPERPQTPFDEAARKALVGEEAELDARTRSLEWLLRRLGRPS